MDNRLQPIMSEKDLDYYEKNLKGLSCSNPHMQWPEREIYQKQLRAYLNENKGKLTRVETGSKAGARAKTGILIDVGTDYIVLKTANGPVSAAIPLSVIDSVIIIHDNNRNRAALY